MRITLWSRCTWGLGLYVCRETAFLHLGPFRLSWFKQISVNFNPCPEIE